MVEAKRDIIIIGAGAAGLMAAIEAGRRGRTVTVIDHSRRPGNKILASGGGRCNFTNARGSHENYPSGNPHFCRSALAQFTPQDFMALLDRHKIGYHEEDSGRLFCDRSSREIVAMLREEGDRAGVEIRLDRKILHVKKDNLFLARTDQGTLLSESLVVATGGLSFPELGASGIGHRIARDFGLRVTRMGPALVPFTFSADDMALFRRLSGISLYAAVSCNKKSFQGSILFTHRGLSGPAILQISLYWNKG